MLLFLDSLSTKGHTRGLGSVLTDFVCVVGESQVVILEKSRL